MAFFRKYRVFFAVVVVVAVVAIFAFQMMDDGGLVPEADDQPQQAILDGDAAGE